MKEMEFAFRILSLIAHAPIVLAITRKASTSGFLDRLFLIGINCEYCTVG